MRRAIQIGFSILALVSVAAWIASHLAPYDYVLHRDVGAYSFSGVRANDGTIQVLWCRTIDSSAARTSMSLDLRWLVFEKQVRPKRCHELDFILNENGVGYREVQSMISGRPRPPARLVCITEVAGHILVLTGAFAVYPAISFIRGPLRRRRRRKRGCCVQCGYNLQGNETGVCPECGAELNDCR